MGIEPNDEPDTGDTLPSSPISLSPDRVTPEVPPGPLPAGSLFDGIYRIVEILGQGTMGVVAHARDERLERDVALKRIHPEHLTHPTARKRFLAEARAMARVHHRNVVEIHAFGEFEGAPYFVMEFVRGTNLEQKLEARRGVRLPIDVSLHMLDQACRGVAAIHASGAVHRDLKPSNILIAQDGRVAVADLGLARLLEQTDGTPGFSGTPAYMAPELILMEDVPPELRTRADVYSLGVMAYELLTGRRPFAGKTIAETLDLQVSAAPLRPSKAYPHLPHAFDAVLLRALAKDPRKRIDGAEAMRRALLEARELARTADGPLRFLLADDDAEYRTLAARTLAKAFPSATIEAVGDGQSALEAAYRDVPALAIIDLDMPGLDGFDLTRALRAHEPTRNVPIVVATGYGASREWEQLSKDGADGFLVKPVDPTQLVSTVEGMLGRKAYARPQRIR